MQRNHTQLPEGKKLKRVTYQYENGDEYFVMGKDLDDFLDNLGMANGLSAAHGTNFKTFSWHYVCAESDERYKLSELLSLSFSFLIIGFLFGYFIVNL